MAIEVTVSDALTQLSIIALEITHVAVTPASAKLRMWSDEAAQAAVETSRTPEAEKLRAEVRLMLKHGKFKASGRSKPAQEYLLRCALEEGTLPRINSPVDVLNTASLVGGLPISLLSIAKCSQRFHLRHGQVGEGYVFNSIGQVLSVEDLVVVCDDSQTEQRPVGSPIKDSLAGKIETSDTSLIAIIYAPRSTAGQTAANKTLQLLSQGLVDHCEAQLGMIIRTNPAGSPPD